MSKESMKERAPGAHRTQIPDKACVGGWVPLRLDRGTCWNLLTSPGSLPVKIPRSPQSHQQGFSPKLHKPAGIRWAPLPSLSYPKRTAFPESPLLSLNFLELRALSSVTVLNPISRWAGWHMPTSGMISVTLLLFLSEP